VLGLKPTPPISEKGKELKEAVTAPEAQRTPVSYNRDLLDQYKPNETYYISAEIREQLHEKGKLPKAGQPAGTYVKDVYNNKYR
jgi:hypothetical protein